MARLVIEKPGHGVGYVTRGVRNSSDILESLLLLKIASMAPGLQKLHRLPVLCSCGFVLQHFGKNPFSSVALGYKKEHSVLSSSTDQALNVTIGWLYIVPGQLTGPWWRMGFLRGSPAYLTARALPWMNCLGAWP